jgi:hypothetical protein
MENRVAHWIPKKTCVDIIDHNDALEQEVGRLRRAGYHRISIERDRITVLWHIEAIKFERVEG